MERTALSGWFSFDIIGGKEKLTEIWDGNQLTFSVNEKQSQFDETNFKISHSNFLATNFHFSVFLSLFLISRAIIKIFCKLELCLETSARHTVFNYLTSYYVQKQLWTTKTFLDGKLCYSLPPPLIHKFLRYRKFSETQNVSPTKFFGTVRQQIFDGKLWYPHLSFIPNIFRCRNFS